MRAMKIVQQLRTTNCKAFKNTGFWKKHYTMSLWTDVEEMKAFARSGAHLEAMKNTGEIAAEVRTVTIDADKLPSWSEAKKMVSKGKSLSFR